MQNFKGADFITFYCYLFIYLFFEVLGIDFWASHILNKYSTIELHSALILKLLKNVYIYLMCMSVFQYNTCIHDVYVGQRRMEAAM